MKALAQLTLTATLIKAVATIGLDTPMLLAAACIYLGLTLAIWLYNPMPAKPQSSTAITRRAPVTPPVVAAPVASPVVKVDAVPRLADADTVTGEQMYYELERNTINATLAPFGYKSTGRILIRARAVVYPLTYSQRRRDGRTVKTKVQSIEEHVLNLTVNLDGLRDEYGYANVGIVVSYSPFALIVNAIHDKPLDWASLAPVAPLQANMGLAAAKATDTPVLWDISDDEDEYFAMLLAGIPKAGKTTLIRSIILQLCKQMTPNALRLYIVENPKGDFEALQALPHVARYVAPDQALALLRFVDAELCQGRPDPARPYSVVVVDEIQAYALDEAYREEFLALVKRILGVGRALRVRLMLATPRPSAEMLSNGIMELIQVRIAGQLGAAGSRIVIRSDHAEQLTTKGAFIMLKDGKETMFYSYHLTGTDMAAEVGAIVERYGAPAPSPRVPESVEAVPVAADTAIRHNGETIRPDILAYVAQHYDPAKGDLAYGTKGKAYKEFYLVEDMRSGKAEAARKNLKATLAYFKSKRKE